MRRFTPLNSRGRLSLRELFLRERDGRMRPSLRKLLLVQRAAAIRRWHMRYQKVSYTLVGVNLIFYL